ncbi:MAG: hypothetical protein OEY01_09890 [Desulfobulbaceae bacterium]|nr:hypothetical protein [Desulfobulbaceae bacterium]HIJ79283.1 hypothetical protein [Deltaproteobacteria bacterium]
MSTVIAELESFIENWPATPEENKKSFVRLKNYLAAKDGVGFDFKPRPGVTYSLRAVHEKQKEQPLFVMVDVIEDEPRWLSICFYASMVNDPAEKGDFVPAGLMGEDAVCFDLAEYNEADIAYLESRLDEAIMCLAG